MRPDQRHTAVVVSPLISLMADQQKQLRERGIETCVFSHGVETSTMGKVPGYLKVFTFKKHIFISIIRVLRLTIRVCRIFSALLMPCTYTLFNYFSLNIFFLIVYKYTIIELIYLQI